jgi:hypothetical protein
MNEQYEQQYPRVFISCENTQQRRSSVRYFFGLDRDKISSLEITL